MTALPLLPARESRRGLGDGCWRRRRLEETEAFFEGATADYRLNVPGDHSDTPEIEGAAEGETLLFKIENAATPEMGVFLDGSYATLDLTTMAGADLALVKTDGQATAAPGQELVYSLTATNGSAGSGIRAFGV